MVILLRMKWFCLGLQLNGIEGGTFLLSVSILLRKCTGDCPNVPGMMRSIVGCNSNIVHFLSTLVNLDNRVQALAHKTWKSKHGLTKTLWNCFVGKSSAGKEMQAFLLNFGLPSANTDKPGNNGAYRNEIPLPRVVLRLTKC